MKADDSSPRAVLFDLDGVLVDTGWAHKQSWYDLARDHGFEMTDEFFYKTFGMQNRLIIPMLVGGPVSDERIEHLSNIKEQRYRDIIEASLVLSDEVGRLLQSLADAGYRMAVGSSAPRRNLDMILERLGIARYFDALVTQEDVHNSKPAPDTFLTAAQKVSVPAERCVVVEDAVQGVQAAVAAAMAVVAVTSTRAALDLTEAGADIVVDNLGRLDAADFDRLIDSHRAKD